jgi:NAD(P)-dependent dehydrogenase (short-subunit alcohol dehydrogenase family)
MPNSRWIAPIAGGVGAGVAAGLLFRSQNRDLQNAVVLITGGSRGLGLALAREFAAEGCRLAICARDPSELGAARQDLEGRGAEVVTIECDVRDQAAVERMVDQVRRHYGRIDVLVNNAGEIQVGPAESMRIPDFEQAMNVMFWGTVYPTMALLPHFRSRGSGRIVNVTSVGGKVAVPHLLPYTCAKFAAVGFSEGLHAELRDTGVKVVTIAPGLMRTGSYLNAEVKGDHDAEAAWFGLSASLPGVSMNADRAARQIVRAAKRGRAEKILTAQANLLSRFHGLFPGLTSELLGLVDQYLLPSGDNPGAKRGHQTKTLRSPAMHAATILGRMAARRFLQPAT